jgi:hypothetical protein
MLFGTLEIVICLGVTMLVIFAVGASLFVRNIAIESKEVGLLRSDAWAELTECPNCHKALNAEAYICRFCKTEIDESLVERDRDHN